MAKKTKAKASKKATKKKTAKKKTAKKKTAKKKAAKKASPKADTFIDYEEVETKPDSSNSPGKFSTNVGLDEIGDLSEYMVYVMEGEFFLGKGKDKSVDLYQEEFCLRETCEGTARAKIKNFLLHARLKQKVEGYKRFRTHEVVSIRPANQTDVDSMRSGITDIMQMTLTDLASFALQENLDVDFKFVNGVQDARVKVRSAWKSGNRANLAYEAKPRPPANEVDADGNPFVRV